MAQPQTDSTGKLVKKTELISKADSVVALVEKMKFDIGRAMPKHLSADKMVRLICTAIRMNPKLAQCNQTSFLGSIMQAAQLGLWPNTPMGFCYLIPRVNRKQDTVDCTILLGYQGMIELSYRTNRVDSWEYAVVRDGDSYEKERGLVPVLRLRESRDPDRESRAITDAYALCRVKDSEFPPWESLSVSQIEARRSRSSSANVGPWVTDYEAMCKKTSIRALFPLVPKSDEMTEAVEIDDKVDSGAVLHYRGHGLSPNVVDGEVDADGVVKDVPVVEEKKHEIGD